MQDLHSSNGTKLRQIILPPDLLQGLLPGDLIEFGNTQLRYHAASTQVPDNQVDLPFAEHSNSQPHSQTKMMPLCQLENAETTLVVASLDATQALLHLHDNQPYTPGTMQEMARRLQAMCQINIAEMIMTSLDGRIWAENHPSGVAKFTFTLPWREPHQRGDSCI